MLLAIFILNEGLKNLLFILVPLSGVAKKTVRTNSFQYKTWNWSSYVGY